MILRPICTLHRRQWLERDLHETFEFFERPENLPRITPPWLRFLGPIGARLDHLSIRRQLRHIFDFRLVGFEGEDPDVEPPGEMAP